MDAKLDTLAASRKLEESGMPRPQAGAAVEVVNDAMRNLVTRKHFNAELDRRFSKEALIKSELPAAHGCAAEFDGASH